MLTTNIILITVYCLLFTYISWKNFSWGLYLFFFLLPTYLIRFNIGSLPTTLLEVILWIITIVWFIKFRSHIINRISHITKQNKILFIGIAIFLLSATISIFTSNNIRGALGEWKAFYVEPIILFLVLITSYQLLITKKIVNNLIFALILSGLITSILAIYQHFTGWLVPYAFWQNQNTFRVTAWYGFPNAVGLFLAPLFPLSLYLVKEKWRLIKITKKQETNNIQYSIFNILIFISCFLFLLSASLAIIFAKSTGSLIGVITGLGLLLLFYKKTRWPTVILSIICLSSLFSFSSFSSIKDEILLQDRSGQIRLSIWHETWQFLKDNPISGAGLASYQEKIKPYHTTLNGEGIEIFHHPHNIFLTMWVNLGLLGLMSFIGILISLFRQSHNTYHITHNNIFIYLISSLIIILVMGLVDSPYIKNDLSVLFWLLPALILTQQSQSVKSLN